MKAVPLDVIIVKQVVSTVLLKRIVLLVLVVLIAVTHVPQVQAQRLAFRGLGLVLDPVLHIVQPVVGLLEIIMAVMLVLIRITIMAHPAIVIVVLVCFYGLVINLMKLVDNTALPVVMVVLVRLTVSQE
jgi:hypothetical protein